MKMFTRNKEEKRYYLWNLFITSSVVTCEARDGDRGNYGMLTYSIVSHRLGDKFAVDADTGM